MKHYLIIVECAIECNGKYLIIRRPEGKHAGGLLAFVGGKVEEQDEAHSFDMLRAAVRRETLEELGLDLTGNVEYITSVYFVESSGISVIDNVFHYKYDVIPSVKPCEREVPWFAWMTKEEIHAAENSPPWLKTTLDLIGTSK